MINACRCFLVVCLVMFPVATFAQNDSHEGGHHGHGDIAHDKGRYLYIRTIAEPELKRNLDQYVLVDVRTPFEFEIIHINGSRNIPASAYDFSEKVKALHEATGKRLVFYSNDNSCHVAFEAADKAISNDKLDKQILVYEGGVAEWATVEPDMTTLLGKTPLDKTLLIDAKDYESHLLEPMAFETRLSKDVVVLDVRSKEQRDSVGLFPAYDKWVRLDNLKRLKKDLHKTWHSGKPVYIYDEMGAQVRWLQYLIRESGIREYYFMNNGAEGYYSMLNKMHLQKKTFISDGAGADAGAGHQHH